MYRPLLSRRAAGRPLRRLLGFALSAVLLLAGPTGQAQTTAYALGNVTQFIAQGNFFFPPGGNVGDQGLAAFNPASGLPNAQPLRITGVKGTQKLVGLDFRPSTGELYALGYSATTDSAQLYRLNPFTAPGVAQFTTLAIPVNTTPVLLALGGTTERIGFDFNPVADRIRVVSSNDANYRLSPATGGIVATDGPLAYAAGDANAGLNPRIGTVAYTNAFRGSTSTTLYDIDVKADPTSPPGILSTQAPPNAGTLTTQAPVRLQGFGIDALARLKMDIYYSGTFNKGYLLELTAPGTDPTRASFGYSASNLYDLSLPTTPDATDPANTNAPGAATTRRTLVPATPAFPFNLIALAIAPRATIVSLVPNSAEVNTAGLTLTVNGTGFLNAATVQFNGSDRATTYVSATQLTATLTTADLATVGTYSVTVTNPPFPGVPSAPATFTVTPTCAAPTNLAASAVTSTSATVSFTGNGSATSYTVTTSPTTTSQTLPATATSVGFTGLMPNTTYTVSITTTCPSGTTGPATVDFVTTPAAIPNPQIAVSQGGTGIANGGTFAGFAGTQVGSTSAPVSFTISNGSATDALTLGAFTFSGPYALSGAAPTSVAPGGTATFDVTFAPTATGANAGSVSIANNSQANSPFVINFSSQGIAQDLVVSTPQAVQGSYRNVTIVGPNGVATLSGGLAVSGTLAVQAGGSLIQNCQTITGPGNFELQAGGALAICDAAGIAPTGAVGAVQVAGTRTFSPQASYLYNGTGAQATGPGLPAQVLNLGVLNTANVTLSQAVAVAGVLRLQAGNLNTGGQNLTLLSSAAGTALVDNAGGAVVGTATVQRYIDPGINAGRGYRHYAAPVANSTVADLGTASYTPVVNPQYNAVGNSVTPFPTVFGFEESRITTSGNTPRTVDFDKGFFSPNSLGDALEVTRGYTVNIPGTETVDFMGLLNNGALSTPTLTRGPQTESGWQLRGNPYPSPLDWSRVLAAGGAVNIENALYVFKSTGQYAGSYTSYVNGQGTNSGTNVLPLGQGFFVRVQAGQATGSIAFTNADRLTTPDNTPFQRGTTDARTQLTLALGNGTSRSQAVVYFEAGATASFDRAFDARSLAAPSGLMLATETPTAEPLAINGQPLLAGPDVLLPLQLAASTAGPYTLAVDKLANLPAGYHAYLRDALTGSFTDLAATPGISLNLAANAPATGRYAVLFSTQPRVLATAPAALAQLASLYPNPARGTATLLLPVALRGTAATAVSVVDNLGRTVLTRTLAAGPTETLALPLSGLAAGIYSVQARTAVGLVVKRLVVQ